MLIRVSDTLFRNIRLEAGSLGKIERIRFCKKTVDISRKGRRKGRRVMILLIDNYDSFSYNLYQYVGSINPDIRVVRNDELTPEEVLEMSPSHIILSPGPGKPSDAGICEDVIRRCGGKIPILGVCLGHQAICEVFGATVTHAKRLMHGKSSVCLIDTGEWLFEGLPERITVARYHSLAAKEETIPDALKIIARSYDDDEIMAVRHREYDIYGLQFHPESILTPDGRIMIENFLRTPRWQEQ